MLQVTPDWDRMGTKDALEKYIGDGRLTIIGPGLYLTNTDTILVLNNEEDDSFAVPNDKEAMYVLYCYNTPLSRTIFGYLDVVPIPIRLDDRT